MKNPIKFKPLIAVVLAIGILAAKPSLASGLVKQDVAGQTVTMSDARGNLVLRLNYSHGCILDQVIVDGREVISPSTGAYSGIEVGGHWVTTQSGIAIPRVSVSGSEVRVKGIAFAAGEVSITEDWDFMVETDRIVWRINRYYQSGGQVDDTSFPAWDFADINTWTGGILDTGGIAWCHLLGDNSTYGAHSGAVTFWKPGQQDALRITTAHSVGYKLASRFSHLSSGVFSYVQSVSPDDIAEKHGLRRFLGSGTDLWAPFTVQQDPVEVDMTIQPIDYDAAYGRGNLRGIDGAATTKLLNTIGRYGAIDRHIVTGNGWVTGFVCLHEPFYGELAAAVDDPNYTANLATSLDDWQDHAIKPDGRVMARWVYEDGMDNMVPGTYDPKTGYYDCGWGYLLDAQPDYAIDVAEEFDLTGDKSWLRSHKNSCERALDWMLARDMDGSGLMSMMTDSEAQQKSSDWIDIVYASGKNALVNAAMYYALNLWAQREEILDDKAHAARYLDAAKKLKAAFVRPISQGGFWDPNKNCFVYWIDKDGSIHGDNLVTPVNFSAVGYGICDDAQRKAILDNIEDHMNQEHLFHWPLCFTSYTPSECRGMMPFPSYENGDIFLSWGELGVRAYAAYDPAIAVKYVRAILNQYGKDGLAYQRYLRQSQTGAGDDILAGNSMTIAGLYRDIYGVRPQWNRLLLDPHITPDLAGTQLRYGLRNQRYDIGLNVNRTLVTVNNFTVRSAGSFAVNSHGSQLACFEGANNSATFNFTRHADEKLGVDITSWPGSDKNSCHWTETSSGHTFPVQCVVSGLKPKATYRLVVNEKTVSTIIADGNGNAKIATKPTQSLTTSFALTPA